MSAMLIARNAICDSSLVAAAGIIPALPQFLSLKILRLRAQHQAIDTRPNGPAIPRGLDTNCRPVGPSIVVMDRFLGRWPRLLELLALWAGIANVGPLAHVRIRVSALDPSGRVQCAAAQRAGQSHVAGAFGPIIARKFTSSIVKFCTGEF